MMTDHWSGTMVVGGSDAVAVVSPTHPSNGFCVKVTQDGIQVCIQQGLEMAQLTSHPRRIHFVPWRGPYRTKPLWTL